MRVVFSSRWLYILHPVSNLKYTGIPFLSHVRIICCWKEAINFSKTVAALFYTGLILCDIKTSIFTSMWYALLTLWNRNVNTFFFLSKEIKFVGNSISVVGYFCLLTIDICYILIFWVVILTNNKIGPWKYSKQMYF